MQNTNFTSQTLIVGLSQKNIASNLNDLISVYRKKDKNVIFNPTIHQIATRYQDFLKNGQQDSYEPVLTTGDGNCFYNAISLQLFGHENHSKRLRLVNVYILCQYQLLFKEICTKTANDYDDLVKKTSKDKTWANELNILAMAIVLDRPIAVWSHFLEKSNNTRVTYTLTFATEEQYVKDYIHIILKDSHFTSLHSKTSLYKLPLLPKVSTFHMYLMKKLI